MRWGYSQISILAKGRELDPTIIFIMKFGCTMSQEKCLTFREVIRYKLSQSIYELRLLFQMLIWPIENIPITKAHLISRKLLFESQSTLGLNYSEADHNKQKKKRNGKCFTVSIKKNSLDLWIWYDSANWGFIYLYQGWVLIRLELRTIGTYCHYIRL